jgi:hypothetical protein
MFCEQCGADLEQDARFCGMCGAKVGNGATNISVQLLSRGISDRRVRLLQIGLIAAVVVVVALGGALFWIAGSEKVDVTDVAKNLNGVNQESGTEVKEGLLEGTLLGKHTAASTELSRAQAAELIQRAKGYPQMRTVWFHKVTHLSPKTYAERYKPLVEKGLFSMQEKPGTDMMFGKVIKNYSNNVGPKGRPYFVNEDSNVFRVKTCELKFLEVTGILPVEEGARVEYTWTYANPTPFAGIGSDPCLAYLNKPQRGEAHFQLYDDGWRLE